MTSSSSQSKEIALLPAAATHTQAVAPDEIAKVTARGRREGKFESSKSF